jgi:hypothetical protein
MPYPKRDLIFEPIKVSFNERKNKTRIIPNENRGQPVIHTKNKGRPINFDPLVSSNYMRMLGK